MSRVGRMVVELEHRSLSGALSFLYLTPFLFDIGSWGATEQEAGKPAITFAAFVMGETRARRVSFYGP
jgi:hypothetical protein